MTSIALISICLSPLITFFLPPQSFANGTVAFIQGYLVSITRLLLPSRTSALNLLLCFMIEMLPMICGDCEKSIFSYIRILWNLVLSCSFGICPKLNCLKVVIYVRNSIQTSPTMLHFAASGPLIRLSW